MKPCAIITPNVDFTKREQPDFLFCTLLRQQAYTYGVDYVRLMAGSNRICILSSPKQEYNNCVLTPQSVTLTAVSVDHNELPVGGNRLATPGKRR